MSATGPRWDTAIGSISESRLKELYPAMPIMLIKAITQDKQVQGGTVAQYHSATVSLCHSDTVAQ